MKVFVAGATGRVATELIKALVAQGHQVVAGARKVANVITGNAIVPVAMDLHAGVLAFLTDYNIAKFFADHWLMSSTRLDYTIIQPGNLQEVKGSGKIQVDVPYFIPNSIENVAQTLAQCLLMQNTYKKVITIADGDTPIHEALLNKGIKT